MKPTITNFYNPSNNTPCKESSSFSLDFPSIHPTNNSLDANNGSFQLKAGDNGFPKGRYQNSLSNPFTLFLKLSFWRRTLTSVRNAIANLVRTGLAKSLCFVKYFIMFNKPRQPYMSIDLFNVLLMLDIFLMSSKFKSIQWSMQ